MIKRLFRRRDRSPPPLSEAELARRLLDPEYRCACCDKPVGASAGAIWPEAPFSWKNPPPPEPDAAFEGGGPEILTANYARRDGDTLLRAYLPIPVMGTESYVYVGVWASLKTGNHARFRAAQARGDADKLGDMFSWLYTQLPRLTGPLLTKGLIAPYPDGAVPLYWITDETHPFFAAQQNGLRPSEILEVYENLGAEDILRHLKA